MSSWVPVVVGLLVTLVGVARLYQGRSISRTTLPWQRRRHHEGDFDGRKELWDDSRQAARSGIVFMAGGALIVIVFAIAPLLR
ncbi:hypothetical protein [Amnibacterium endophyticum]|uniref:Uncharacterized protein n=1 Tax=Amnibacterium endophyticum TaxID=2109337 RepID=A0ABW4LI26_9MICO